MQLSKMDVHDFTQLLCEVRDGEESERGEDDKAETDREEGGGGWTAFVLLICEPGSVFSPYNDSNNT